MFGIASNGSPVRALGTALLLSILGAAAALGAAVLLFRHAGPAVRRVTIHKVAPGETAPGIAEKYYGDRKMWPKLARFNGLTGAGQLESGRQLTIPRKGLFLHPDWLAWAFLITFGALVASLIVGAGATRNESSTENMLVSAAAFAGSASALLAGTMTAGTLLVLDWSGIAVVGSIALGLLGGVVVPALAFHAAGAGAGRSVAAGTVVATAAGAGAMLFAGTCVLYLP